ncbi:hypothetical protein [Sulfitobacter sp. M22]|uniref:hypothetical protein n=1 Tax=Sulfitobacter sp. M22 TaxID=2675332 RepID=UPI001F2D3E47|nr:hypothetical protein [Sulfitobacter sp. M22]MCF7728010.1 hypothetical protein [Sulfitobacter sp. M22]
MTNDDAAPLDIVVLVALLAKDRLPPVAIKWLNGRLRGEETIDFSLEKHPEGWVWGLSFRVPEKDRHLFGSRVEHPRPKPLPTKRRAFLAGAAALCDFFTHSKELPFIATDTQLIVTGSGDGGYSEDFTLRWLGPWVDGEPVTPTS